MPLEGRMDRTQSGGDTPDDVVLVHRGSGGWLAVGSPAMGIRIAVEGLTREDALRQYGTSSDRWVQLLDESRRVRRLQ